MIGTVLRLAISAVVVGAGMAFPAMAQQATAIVPNGAGSAFFAGTTVSKAGAVTTIDGGTLAGSNLFHSFASFDLAAGETARWTTTLTDPARVSNVINRVIGGRTSQIGGTLDSTALPQAAFFFINPAGIVFGKDAQVNVPGAAWFSAAKALRFADGSALSATTADGSVFSVSAPQSFGFLGQDGNIVLEGTRDLVANPASSLGLVGADITARNAVIGANRIVVAAVGDQKADFAVAQGSTAPGALTGRMILENTQIAVLPSGDAGETSDPGQLALHAGRMTIRGGKLVSNAGCRVVDECVRRASSGAIKLTASQIRLDRGLKISTSTFATGTAGDVVVRANSLVMFDSVIASQTVGCKSGNCQGGNAGKIDIATDFISMRRRARISTRSYNSAPAGAISIRSDRAQILDRSIVSSDARIGAAGSITIDLKGGDSILRLGIGSVVSTSSKPGRAGVITITAPRAVISNGGSIFANGQEGGADVRIASRFFLRSTDQANRISLNGSIEIDSNIYDVSAGIIAPKVDFLDASTVLLGQCASARVTGITSQLRWHNTGPYADPPNRSRRELSSLVDLLDNPLC